MVRELRGILSAMCTPFTPDGSRIDEEALRDLVDGTIEAGVHGLVPCGSTGEFAALTTDERRRATAIVLEQARGRSAEQSVAPLDSIRQGDARQLVDWDSNQVDAVLLLGPLYHLTERAERIQALREAVRVLKPGGLLVAAAVGRFASLLDGIVDNLLADPDYAAIVARDLRDGQHRDATERNYFTTAFFHLPRELEDEVREAGFERVEILGLEGPGWMLADLEARWADPARRRQILDAARAIEREPTLMGLHAHILAVGRKPT